MSYDYSAAKNEVHMSNVDLSESYLAQFHIGRFPGPSQTRKRQVGCTASDFKNELTTSLQQEGIQVRRLSIEQTYEHIYRDLVDRQFVHV